MFHCIKYFFTTALFLLCLHASAGGPNKQELENARKAFPDADAMFLDKNEHVTIELVNGELKVSSKIDERIYFATEKSDFYRKSSIYHSYFTEVSDVEATIETNIDGKYKEMKVEHFTTEDNVNANVFYDDLKEVNFAYPGVSAGAVGRLSYTEKLKDPHFTSPFYFVSYIPVINADYSITFPTSVKLNFKVFNNDSGQVVFTKEEKGKTITYKWHAKNVKNAKREEEAPAYAYYAPHILVSINEYTDNEKTQLVLPDLKGMCEWYGSFVKNINKDDDSLLTATVRNIVKGAPDDKEKIRRIYYWVQDNINYIAFEDGLNGFIPREAKDICHRRYGDCKDMSSILVKMLRLAGIKAYHTWIGSRRLPYRYSEIASPSIDDHMICVADANGKRYVLDGTGKFTPLGFVTSFIQSKEGMIMKEDGQCEIYPIPVMSKESSVRVDTITVYFKEKNVISGRLSQDLSGYYKINSAYTYHYTLPEKREEKFQDKLKMGNNKCKVSDVHFSGFNGQDSAMRITASFELPEYIKNIGEKIYINPSLIKEEQGDNIDMTERKLPFEVDHKGIRKEVTIINVPDGYELNYKPEDMVFKGNKMNASVKYETSENRIIQTTTIEVDFLILPLKEIPEWNKMIEETVKAYKENIVFRKK